MNGPAATVRRRHATKERVKLHRLLNENLAPCRREYLRQYRRNEKIRQQLLLDEVAALQQRVQKLEKENVTLRQQQKEQYAQPISQDKAASQPVELQFVDIDLTEGARHPRTTEERNYWISQCRAWIHTQLYSHQRFLPSLMNLCYEVFEEVWSIVEPHLAGLNAEGDERVYVSAQPQHFTDKEQFFLCCVWCNLFLEWQPFAILTGYLDGRYLARVVHRVLCAFERAYDEVIKMPASTEVHDLLATKWASFFKNGHDKWNDMAFLVDGSSFDVPRPSSKDVPDSMIASMKPPHKSRFVVNALFLVQLDGCFVARTPVHLGSHDQRDWKESGLRQLFVGKSYGVGGDSMFTFNTVSEEQKIIGYLPPKKSRGQKKLRDDQLLEYTLFAQLRVVVENAIGRLKTWGCLSQKFRYFSLNRKPVCTLDQCIAACMVMEQVKMRKHPLRPPSWEPMSVEVVHSHDRQRHTSGRKLVFSRAADDVIETRIVNWD